ncbi:MAG: hypothetical protein ACYDGY_03150 [Acidimicrobiales bacterium]
MLGDDVLGLPAQVAELAEAQKRTENRLDRLEKTVAELAEAQKQTNQSVAELAEAQKRTENRLDRLEKTVAELAEAQKQTNQSVAELAEAQKQTNQAIESLRSEVGNLSQVVGGTVEEDAKVLLEYVATQNGWQIIKEPAPIDININGTFEIDVMAVVRDVDRKDFALLCEAKTRLRPTDVRRFKTTVNKLPQNADIPSDHLYYMYGLSVYPGTREVAEEMGFGLLSPRGELVKPKELLSQ